MALKLLDIEKELGGQDSEAAFKRYDDILARLDARISEATSSGLPPNEFSRINQLKEANIIARKILRLAVKDRREAYSVAAGDYQK